MGKEMVICPECGKEVKAQGLAPHRRMVHGDGMIIRQGKQEAPPETASITASKNVTLSGEDLGAADMLIKAGFAKDLNELTHKSLNLTYSNLNRMGGYMENPREETMEDVNKMRDRDIIRKYKELQIKAMEKELEGKKQENPEDEDKLIKQMERQIRIKTMKKALDEGGEFNFDKLMQMKMMDRMFDSGKSSEVQAMQNQLNNLTQQLQQERLVAAQQLQNERVMQKIEQMGSQPGLTAQDVLTFTTDKDRVVKEMDVKFQQERDKNLSQAMEARVRDIEKQISQTGGVLNTQRLQEFREELKAIKEMSHELGEREKGAGEYISETVGNLANTLQPTLTRLIEQKERQKEMQMMAPPIPQNPGLELLDSIEEPLEHSEHSDLTAAEKQISDQMSDMYINKKKR